MQCLHCSRLNWRTSWPISSAARSYLSESPSARTELWLSSDVHTPAQRSFNMSRIRGHNTKPEVSLRKALWRLGLRYTLNSKLPGKPDLVFPKYRTALFVDGCFWHGCSLHMNWPKNRAEFWQ